MAVMSLSPKAQEALRRFKTEAARELSASNADRSDPGDNLVFVNDPDKTEANNPL